MNTYPTVRGFTAIGTGGQDFVQAMLVAVESVIQQPIPQVLIGRVYILINALDYKMIRMACILMG